MEVYRHESQTTTTGHHCHPYITVPESSARCIFRMCCPVRAAHGGSVMVRLSVSWDSPLLAWRDGNGGYGGIIRHCRFLLAYSRDLHSAGRTMCVSQSHARLSQPPHRVDGFNKRISRWTNTSPNIQQRSENFWIDNARVVEDDKV